MSQKNIRWLHSEIPELLRQGVLSPKAALQLQRHYTGREGGSRRNLAVTLFSILGALLVGGGILLLLAHNWDSLSRPARIGISLAPLLATQALGAWTITRRKATIAWRESVGIGLTLALGIAIALVSQTYNIPGNLDELLLTCILLSLPVVYLLDSATAVVLLLAAITAWAADAGPGGMSVVGFSTLIALVVPYLWKANRSRRHPAWLGLLGWALALSLTVGVPITMHGVVPHGLIPVFGGLFAALVATGGIDPWRRQPWSPAFRIVGALGAVTLAVVLTYRGLWEHLRPRIWQGAQTLDEEVALVLTGALVLCAPVLVGIFHHRMSRRTIALACTSVVSLAAWSFIWNASPQLAAPILYNLYLFVLGLVFLMEGVASRSLGAANGGMAILALLMAVRFFDPSISFVIRGLLFIAVGMGFLMTNVYLVRKKKRLVT